MRKRLKPCRYLFVSGGRVECTEFHEDRCPHKEKEKLKVTKECMDLRKVK